MNTVARRLRLIVPVAAVVFVGLAGYGRVVSFGFAKFDDEQLILERREYLSHASNIIDAFSRDYWYGTHSVGLRQYYRPLVTVSFIVDGLIAPQSPQWAHCTNLILHLLAALLLLAILRRMLHNEAAALLLALLFAAHPLASNAVGWIPGRNDTLLAIFALSSFLALLVYLRSGSIGALAGFAGAFAAALFTKETALALPVVFAVWMLIEPDGRREHRWLPLSEAALGAVAIWWIARSGVQLAAPGGAFAALLANLIVIVQGLGKVIAPVNLSVLSVIADTTPLYGMAATLLLAALIVAAPAPRRARMAFGAAWFLILLAPSLITGQEASNLVLECRLYLPMIGVIIVLSQTKIVQSFAWNGIPLAVGAALIALLVVLSNIFSSPYHDEMTLWQSAVRTSPSSPLAHVNYGEMLRVQKRFDEAERETREAVRLDPRNPMAHSNLGDLLFMRGAIDSAAAEYNAQIALTPGNPFPYHGLAMIAVQRMDNDQAIRYLRQSLRANPAYPDAWIALANAYIRDDNVAGVAAVVERLHSLGIAIPANVRAYLAAHE